MSSPPERHAAVLDAVGRQIGRALTMAKHGWRDEGEFAGLEGRRRILQRHAPMVGEPRCDRCSYYLPTPWPCADWLDAAAGVERREDTPDDH